MNSIHYDPQEEIKSTTPPPNASQKHTVLWSPTSITQPISVPRLSLTTPRNSLHLMKHYKISSHRLIPYPWAEASSDRTANSLPPARWVPHHTGPQHKTRSRSPPPLYAILSKKRTITWRHVIVHSDQKWNDYVDHLANLGRAGSRDISA